MKIKVLLTGATGFIGGHLTRALIENGYEVNCIIRNPKLKSKLPNDVNIFLGDLNNVQNISDCMNGVNVVIHLAAQLGHYGIKPETYYNVNYLATLELLKLAIENNVSQFIFCSALFVSGYGKRIPEDAPYAPKGDYAETKAIAEKSLQEIAKDKINYTIIRPGYVYGPGDVRRVSLYRNIMKKRFVLTVNGKAHLSPSYITDIVDGFLLTIKNEKAYNEIFNIAGIESTTQEYLESIADTVGSKLIKFNMGYTISALLAMFIDYITILLFNKPGFVTKSRIDFLALDHSGDILKAKEILGYEPKVTLREGTEKTIAWFKEQGYM